MSIILKFFVSSVGNYLLRRAGLDDPIGYVTDYFLRKFRIANLISLSFIALGLLAIIGVKESSNFDMLFSTLGVIIITVGVILGGIVILLRRINFPKRVRNMIKDKLSNVVNQGKEVVVAGTGMMKNGISNGVKSASDGVSNAAKAVAEKTSSVTSAIGEAATNGLGSAKEVASDKLAHAKDTASEGLEKAKDVASDGLEKAKDVTSDGLEKAKDAASGGLNNAKKFVGSIELPKIFKKKK